MQYEICFARSFFHPDTRSEEEVTRGSLVVEAEDATSAQAQLNKGRGPHEMRELLFLKMIYGPQ
jgi:hypothetical protein